MGGIELDNIFGESLLFLENLVELSTVDEGHHEVKAGVRLKKILHTAKEGMVSLKENVLLQSSRLNLVVLYQNILTNSLDSILLPSGWQERKVNSAESTLS